MRTQDRTYLQALGFEDPDRKDDMHNNACLYLTQKEKLLKILNLVGLKPFEDEWSEWRLLEKGLRRYSHYRSEYPEDEISKIPVQVRTKNFRRVKELRPVLNSPIVQENDYGSYKRIVGYIDLEIKLELDNGYMLDFQFPKGLSELQLKTLNDRITERWGAERIYVHDRHTHPIYVEVKNGYVDTPTIIQQLNTYREFSPGIYVAATTYGTNELYRKVLHAHQIHYCQIPKQAVTDFIGQNNVTDITLNI